MFLFFPGEQPKGNLISDVDRKQSECLLATDVKALQGTDVGVRVLLLSDQQSAEDEGEHHGAFKRFSAMWSSFRRGRKDRK